MGAECGRDSAAGAARKGFRAERVDAVLGRSDFAGPWAWHPAICDPETCAQNAHQLRRKGLISHAPVGVDGLGIGRVAGAVLVLADG